MELSFDDSFFNEEHILEEIADIPCYTPIDHKWRWTTNLNERGDDLHKILHMLLFNLYIIHLSMTT